MTVADRTSKLEFMEHFGALTYRRCVTIVVHNYGCNWYNGVHRGPRARAIAKPHKLPPRKLHDAATPNETVGNRKINFLSFLSAKNNFCYLVSYQIGRTRNSKNTMGEFIYCKRKL